MRRDGELVETVSADTTAYLSTIASRVTQFYRDARGRSRGGSLSGPRVHGGGDRPTVRVARPSQLRWSERRRFSRTELDWRSDDRRRHPLDPSRRCRRNQHYSRLVRSRRAGPRCSSGARIRPGPRRRRVDLPLDSLGRRRRRPRRHSRRVCGSRRRRRRLHSGYPDRGRHVRRQFLLRRVHVDGSILADRARGGTRSRVGESRSSVGVGALRPFQPAFVRRYRRLG